MTGLGRYSHGRLRPAGINIQCAESEESATLSGSARLLFVLTPFRDLNKPSFPDTPTRGVLFFVSGSSALSFPSVTLPP